MNTTDPIAEMRDLQSAIMHFFYDFSQTEIAKKSVLLLDKSEMGIFARAFDFIQKNGLESMREGDYISREFYESIGSESVKDIITPILCPTYFSMNIQKLIIDLVMIISKERIKKDMDLDILKDLFDRIDTIKNVLSGTSLDKYSPRSIYTEMMGEVALLDSKKGLLGYSTGIKTLDQATEGLQKGTVMRLSAYSNVGKSKLSYHICNAVLRQRAKVVYFSLEVSKLRVMQNLMMNWYNLSYYQATRGEWTTMIDPADLMTKDITIVDDVYDLERMISITESIKPDVVFIDFVQNINTIGGSEYEKMTRVAVQIQQLAIKNNIAVFDLSQVSNDGAKYTSGGIIPSKGSGALVASADVGLVMTRDKQLDMNILYLAKNKFGPNNRAILLDFDFGKGQVTDKGEYKDMGGRNI